MKTARKYPSTRIIYDRRHTSSKDEPATVEIEILHQGKRKWISTGVRVLPNEWKDENGVIYRTDAFDLNTKIQKLHININDYIHGLIKKDQEFSWESFESFLAVKNDNASFIEFIELTNKTKTDIKKITAKNHLRLLNSLKLYGKIKYFSDITPNNIIAWDKWLHEKEYKQTTISTYHKFMKIYIHDAMRKELIDRDPYVNFKVERGKPALRQYLTPDELDRIISAELPGATFDRVRDLFLFQCYTGLAYADLNKFDFNKVIERDGKYIIHDVRHKTGEDYYIVLLSNAIAILKKYDYKLPLITNQQYNMRLKIVAGAANLGKKLTSHMGRHTYASLVLNQGIPLEVLKEMMGHSDIKTTQIYAKMMNKTVEAAYDMLDEKLNNTRENNSIDIIKKPGDNNPALDDKWNVEFVYSSSF